MTGLLALACGGSAEPSPTEAWWYPPVSHGDALVWQFDPGTESAEGTFTGTAGGWSVQPASEAPSPPAAVCREAHGDPTLLLRQQTPLDFDARVRVWTAAGDRAHAGLIFGQHGEDRYYLARAASRNNNLRLYRRQGGAWSLLGSRDRAVPVGQWHEILVRAREGQITVGLDGEAVLQASASSPRAGGLALWAEADARVCFDDVWLIPLAVEPSLVASTMRGR